MNTPEDPAAKRHKLIAEIYEVALKPELYGNLVDLWETQIEQAVSRLQSLEEASRAGSILNDPELEDHFKRAHQILERMGRRPAIEQTPQDMADARSEACLLFGERGDCLALNKAAVRLFGKIRNLADFSAFVSEEETRSLQQMCVRSARPLSDAGAQMMRIFSGEKGQGGDERLFVFRHIRHEAENRNLVMLSELTATWNENTRQLLEANFSLTRSEISVIRGLLAGQTLQQIAEQKKRSLHTVKTQMKSVLQKTGSNSQTDVIRKTMALASHAGEGGQAGVIARYGLTEGEEQLLDLGGGRLLPVNCFGPPDGRPVLFIHGMLDGFVFSRDIATRIERNNIRLIAPTRAGFGECRLHYTPATAPTEFATDVGLVLDQMEVETCPVIGHMAGSVYAFETARCLGDRITGIVNVAGGVPITSLSQFAAMSPRQRVIAWTARFTPRLLPTLLRAGIAQIDTGNTEAFMNALYPGETPDKETVRDPAIAAAIQQGYNFAVAQGHLAFQYDSSHVTRNWSEYVRPGGCPVHLVHGSHDPVVEIGSVRSFAGRFERINLLELEDCGQLVLFQKPEAVFDIVCNLLATEPAVGELA